MKLICIGSSSKGNCYALDAGGEILLLEAGVKYKEVQKAINFRGSLVVGCVVTHRHGDHAKYIEEYAKRGIKIYGNSDLIESKTLPSGKGVVMPKEKTCNIEGFQVVPFDNFHDVPIYGYLIRHKQMGTMLFSTDSFKIGIVLKGVNHFLIEANYSDAILKDNVWNGKVHKSLADRIMLSHMSLDYCIKYLKDCEATESAKNIILCHLSGQNSDADQFHNIVAGAFGIPTYCASKGLEVYLY